MVAAIAPSVGFALANILFYLVAIAVAAIALYMVAKAVISISRSASHLIHKKNAKPQQVTANNQNSQNKKPAQPNNGFFGNITQPTQVTEKEALEIISKYKGLSGNALQDMEEKIFATEAFRSNQRVVTAAINSSYGYAIMFANEELQKDRGMALLAAKKHSSLTSDDRNNYSMNYPQLLCIIKAFQQDDEIARLAIIGDSVNLEFASKKLQEDKEVVKAAVEQNAFALKFAGEKLKKEKEIVMVAASNSHHICSISIAGFLNQAIDSKFLNDQEIFLPLILEHFRDTLTYLKEKNSSLINNPEFILKIIEALPKDSNEIQELLSNNKSNLHVMRAAVAKFEYALSYASKALKESHNFVKFAVAHYPSSLEYASEALKKDKELGLASVKWNGDNIKFLDKTLQGDIDIVIQALYGNCYDIEGILEIYAIAATDIETNNMNKSAVVTTAIRHIRTKIKSDQTLILKLLPNKPQPDNYPLQKFMVNTALNNMFTDRNPIWGRVNSSGNEYHDINEESGQEIFEILSGKIPDDYLKLNIMSYIIEDTNDDNTNKQGPNAP